MKLLNFFFTLLLFDPSTVWADMRCPKDAIGTSRTITITENHETNISVKNGNKIGLKEKEIILTFDDGPDPEVTPKILDLLEKECIKASFFLIGQKIAKDTEILNLIANKGHTIGYHSWSHPRFHQLTPHEIEDQLSKNINVIEKNLENKAKVTNFFRYPHLNRSDMSDLIVKSHGLTSFDADFMVPDWKDIPPIELHNMMMSQIRDGEKKGIIIIHEHHQRNIDFLKLLIETFKKENYKIVHLSYN